MAKGELMVNTIENYIHTKKLDLNLVELKTNSFNMYCYIKENFVPGKNDYSGQSTMTTQLYAQYNLLLYPISKEFHSLYKEIVSMFKEICPSDEFNDNQFYLQCWLNFYRKGDFIDWHSHWPPDENGSSWHGFYCVDCEPSKTTYRIPNIQNEVDVVSENNLLVISRSDGDTHRTWPWHKNSPRITIAFDIVNRKTLNKPGLLDNHWIPII